MNIDSISDKTQFTSLGKISGNQQRIRSGAGSSRGDDEVVVSDFGKVMARAAKDLKSDLNPRPEVIDQYQPGLQDPVKFSDSVVSAILKRMMGQ